MDGWMDGNLVQLRWRSPEMVMFDRIYGGLQISSVNPGKPREERNHNKIISGCALDNKNATKSTKKITFFFSPVDRFESTMMFRELRGRVCSRRSFYEYYKSHEICSESDKMQKSMTPKACYWRIRVWSGQTPIRSVNGTCPQILVRSPRRLYFQLWLSVNRITPNQLSNYVYEILCNVRI